jgi:hypothetical protein
MVLQQHIKLGGGCSAQCCSHKHYVRAPVSRAYFPASPSDWI